ncbi:MAG: hypothetical protein ACXW5U_18720 [Thermoanaerobaculia bacterium]
MRIIVAVLASLVWLKGNLHTHTAMSDGDSTPQEMAAWYRDHGQGPPSVEAMWDEMLTAGMRVWGVAVDDSHHLKRPWDKDVALPGKAWVVVRTEKADAKSILGALESGEFYASTGVELEEVAPASVKVKEKNGARYRIIGAKGRVLQETVGPSASYSIRGDGVRPREGDRLERALRLDTAGLCEG